MKPLLFSHIPLPVFLLLSILGVLSACSEQAVESSNDPYFSVKEYLYQDSVRLDSTYSQLIKRATINDKTELDTFQVKSWREELSALVETDIDKPALVGKYEVKDSTAPDGKNITIYRARSSDEETQRLEVHRTEGEVVLLTINARSKNFIYRSMHQLTYRPDRGFTIDATQKVALGEEEEFLMEATFLD